MGADTVRGCPVSSEAEPRVKIRAHSHTKWRLAHLIRISAHNAMMSF